MKKWAWIFLFIPGILFAREKYGTMTYLNLTTEQFDLIVAHYQSFKGTGPSKTHLFGDHGILTIDVAGPNVTGYLNALKAQIRAQVGVDPFLFDPDIPMESARMRTAKDVREHGGP